MYDITNVTKRFSHRGRVITALEDVSLHIDPGEMLAIQGPTGQGKTTLLQLLGGLDRPTSGSILFEGRELRKLGEVELTDLRARAFGFVFQTFNLIPTLSALENVEAALVPLQTPPDERRRQAERSLEEVGLADRAGHLPSELSGGQQQRVAIARALVKEPQVLLADGEPRRADARRHRASARDPVARAWPHLGRRHARQCGGPPGSPPGDYQERSPFDPGGRRGQ